VCPTAAKRSATLAGTAATIETNGSYSGLYNLFAFGFGLWTSGAQEQAGLTEPLNYAVTGVNGGEKFRSPVIRGCLP
jgi:hypothetical protein